MDIIFAIPLGIWAGLTAIWYYIVGYRSNNVTDGGYLGGFIFLVVEGVITIASLVVAGIMFILRLCRLL